MPVFRNYTALPKAVDSILRQSVDIEFDMELVILDDGSGDGGTVWTRICDLERQIKSERPALQVVKIKRLRNDGQGIARGHGVAAANADWLCYLDVDDVMHRDRIKNAWQFITEYNSKADLILSDYIVEQKDGTQINVSPKLFQSGLLKASQDNLISDSIGILHSKDIYYRVGGWPPFLLNLEDGIMLRRMIQAGAVVDFEDRIAGVKHDLAQRQGRTQRRFDSGLYIMLDRTDEAGAMGQYLDNVSNYNPYFMDPKSDPEYPKRSNVSYTFSFYKTHNR